ncbi:MAG TPA: hypothetical protein VGA38_06320, partial [Candidatus Limnocylindria bacterium]
GVGDSSKACRYEVGGIVDRYYAVWTIDRNVRVDVLIVPAVKTDEAAISEARRLAAVQLARIDRLVPR